MNTAAKKGLHPLAWVAIGCGALLVIGLVVVVAGGLFVAKKVGDVAEDFEKNPTKAAAELVVKLNPELDLVESDEAAGTMTVRNNKTGEQATLNFDDIAEGRFSFQNDDGETVSFDASAMQEGEGLEITSSDGSKVSFGGGSNSELPDWVHLYPAASKPQAAYTSSTAEGETGMFSSTSDDDVETVAAHYEEKLKEQGYEVQNNRISSGDALNVILTAEKKDPKRSVEVNVLRQDGKSQITTQYNGKS